MLLELCSWNGKSNHEFVVIGETDANFAKESKTRNSVSGSSVFPEQGSLVVMKSGQQVAIILSTIEVELMVAALCG